jgi:hypothetical protein
MSLNREDVNAVVVARIFNRATMEKTIPPYHLTVAGEEEEKINKSLKLRSIGMERP